MPTLKRYQPLKFKLPRAWKFILALLILASLVVFKDLFYQLEKNEIEQLNLKWYNIFTRQNFAAGYLKIFVNRYNLNI